MWRAEGGTLTNAPHYPAAVLMVLLWGVHGVSFDLSWLFFVRSCYSRCYYCSRCFCCCPVV